MKADKIVVSLARDDEDAVRETASQMDMGVAEYLGRAIRARTSEDAPAFGRRSYCDVNAVEGRSASWSLPVHARAAELSADLGFTNLPPSEAVGEIAPGQVLQYGDATEPVGSDIGNMTILVLDVGLLDGAPVAQVCPVYRAFDDEPEAFGEPRVTMHGRWSYKALVADIRHVRCDRTSFPYGTERHETLSARDLQRSRAHLADVVRRVDLASSLSGSGPVEVVVKLESESLSLSLTVEESARYRAVLQILGISHDTYWTMSVRAALASDKPRLRVYGPDLSAIGDDYELVREEGESDDDFAKRLALESVIQDVIGDQLHEDSVERAKRTLN